MITATKRWLRRNRTGFAIGLGVIGIGYVAGQYVVSKIVEAKERMASDRMSKENLRRRFQQNQEDCTITVLELLPTVVDDIVNALPAEEISKEIQQRKADRTRSNQAASGIASSDFSSGTPSAADEDGKSSTSFQSDSYVHASQMGASSSGGTDKPAKTKVQLWHDLKIKSITRAFTLIYTLTLLCLLTRIQLNLLGRKNYITSVVNLHRRSSGPTISLENNDHDVDRSYVNDFEINRKFLTFSWWLLHRGWREIMIKVEIAVKEVFATVKPTEDLPLDRLSSLILDVRRGVEGSTPEERKSRQWLPYLLPSQDLEDHVLRESGVSGPSSSVSASSPPPQDPTVLPSPPDSPLSRPSSTSPAPLRRLLDETSDLIDSPLFTHVLTLLLDAAFSQLTDQKIRMEAYKLPALSSPPPASSPAQVEDVTEEQDPATATAKLATIMAVMTREARAIGSGVPNAYLQAMEGVGELEGFAAVVYSSNFDLEDHDIDSPEVEAHRPTAPLEGLSSVEADETLRSTGETGIAQRAAGVMDAAWGGFESVWGKVTGGGEDVTRG